LPEGEKKDRLIQTRVAEDLEETLRDAAKARRVSVSQLIRNVLEDTFQLVDNVVADAASLGATVKRDAVTLAATAKRDATNLGATVKRDAARIADAARGRSRSTPVADTWQEVIVAREQVCSRCRRKLAYGDRAMIGLGPEVGTSPFLCITCATELSISAG
jgi:hypothetical protein